MRPSHTMQTRYLRRACLLTLCAGTALLPLAACSGKNTPFAKNRKTDLQTASLAMPPEMAARRNTRPVQTIPVPTTQMQQQARLPDVQILPPVKTAAINSLRTPAGIDPRRQRRLRQPATSNIQTAAITRPQASKSMVVLKSIKGASVPANHIFMRAMHRQLTAAGFAVTELPRQSTLLVTGTAQLGAMRGKQQAVTLSWQVYDTKGVRIGSVIQKNHIPRATFATTWSGNARHAAYAAAPGIVKLLHQAR